MADLLATSTSSNNNQQPALASRGDMVDALFAKVNSAPSKDKEDEDDISCFLLGSTFNKF